MTIYHQPNTTMGLALYWAGDLEAARPLLERAAQQALARGEEWDRLGVAPDARPSRMGRGKPTHRRAAPSGGRGGALGEFGEGLLWLVVLDARYALERGDLAEARAKAEHGLALAERTSRAWQIARLDPDPGCRRAGVWPARAAHGRLEWIRDWLTVERVRPGGTGQSRSSGRRTSQALVASWEARGGRGNPGRAALTRGGLRQPRTLMPSRSRRGAAARRPRRARRGDRRHGPRLGCPCALSPAVRARPHAAREGFDRTAGQAQGCGQANPRAGAGHARAARRAGLGLTDPRRAVPDRPPPGKSGRTG